MAHLPHPSNGRQGQNRTSWHPSDYLRVLYKRRWVAVPGFLLVFLWGAIGTIRTVPIYEARTQILIDKDARRATSINTVLEERESWYADDFYPTQYRVLQSRSLALRTAEALQTQKTEQVPPDTGLSFSPSGLVAMAVSQVQTWFGPAPAPATESAPAPVDAPSARVAALADRVQGGIMVVPSATRASST
jgi:uncharacterized protein involved in exopolysaccharide biosynthesis